MVLRVKAEDGDKGSPRDINYVIMVDNNPFAPFFFMEPQTGKIFFIPYFLKIILKIIGILPRI